MSATVKYVRVLEALYFMIRQYIGLWQNIALGVQIIFLHSWQILVSILEEDKYEWVQVDADRPSGRSQSL